MTTPEKREALAKAANHMRAAIAAMNEIIASESKYRNNVLSEDAKYYRHQLSELLSCDDGEAGLEHLIQMIDNGRVHG